MDLQRTVRLYNIQKVYVQNDLERKKYEVLKQFLILFFQGPALRVWYEVLNRHIGSAGKGVAIRKVFIDQFIFAPSFLVMILVTVGAMQGKSWDNIKVDLSSNYLDVLKTNYFIWPWVQLVNFYYVPLQYQVLLVQSVALFWNTYLSWKTNRRKVLEQY